MKKERKSLFSVLHFVSGMHDPYQTQFQFQLKFSTVNYPNVGIEICLRSSHRHSRLRLNRLCVNV